MAGLMLPSMLESVPLETSENACGWKLWSTGVVRFEIVPESVPVERVGRMFASSVGTSVLTVGLLKKELNVAEFRLSNVASVGLLKNVEQSAASAEHRVVWVLCGSVLISLAISRTEEADAVSGRNTARKRNETIERRKMRLSV